MLFGVPPSYTDLRVFGCRCFPNLIATSGHKLAARSTPCVFIGYPADHHGYRCYNVATRRVITSRHVIFDESVFPFRDVAPPVTAPPQVAMHDPPPEDPGVVHTVPPPPPSQPRLAAALAPHPTRPRTARGVLS
jgi:histone deacetylase 1/2